MGIHISLNRTSGNGIPHFSTYRLLCSALGRGESTLGSWGRKDRLLCSCLGRFLGAQAEHRLCSRFSLC